jgi:hypothetical protein
MNRPVANLMAEALIGAAMLRPVIHRIRSSDSEAEIVAIVNDAIDRDWLQPHQLPLLEEGIVA